MGKYTTKGLYNGYDKNHKERDKDDYYATDPKEVENILRVLSLPFDANTVVLEPCAGGGHMIQGIKNYCSEVQLIATDYTKHKNTSEYPILTGEDYDFLSDNYHLPQDKIDWVIMNPPFKTLEPFLIRSLEIAEKGVLMFARLQFLEGQSRYETVLKDNPPSKVFVYVDRVQCWKNGEKPEGSSAQAYAWFLWDKNNKSKETQLSWIRRA